MPRYIDADALAEEIKSMRITVVGMRSGKGFLDEFANGLMKRILRKIEDAPAADVVPVRTGYWVIVQTKNPTSVTMHRCSNPDCRLTTYARRLPPYCQECGSKMLGEVREDDDKYLMQET